MSEQAAVKWLAVTKQDAELMMDSFKVSNPMTRPLAMKAASLVLEFAGADALDETNRVLTIHRTVVAEAEGRNGPGRGPDAAVDGGATPPPASAA